MKCYQLNVFFYKFYRTTGDRFFAEAKDFSSSLCVQTSSEAHPTSYSMGSGGPFPGDKSRRGVTLNTPIHLPLAPAWRVAGHL
jgi:hypothetical protein